MTVIWCLKDSSKDNVRDCGGKEQGLLAGPQAGPTRPGSSYCRQWEIRTDTGNGARSENRRRGPSRETKGGGRFARKQTADQEMNLSANRTTGTRAWGRGSLECLQCSRNEAGGTGGQKEERKRLRHGPGEDCRRTKRLEGWEG